MRARTRVKDLIKINLALNTILRVKPSTLTSCRFVESNRVTKTIETVIT